MEDGEQTNKANETGTEVNNSVEDNTQPLSLYDKTEAIVQRQEAANKKTEELLERQEKLHANQRLAGTSGGHIEEIKKEETPKEYRERIDKEIVEGKHND